MYSVYWLTQPGDWCPTNGIVTHPTVREASDRYDTLTEARERVMVHRVAGWHAWAAASRDNYKEYS